MRIFLIFQYDRGDDYTLQRFTVVPRNSKYGYSERMKLAEIEGFYVPVHVVDDLSDEELVNYFRIAFERGDYEHCSALHVEATRRNIKLEI